MALRLIGRAVSCARLVARMLGSGHAEGVKTRVGPQAAAARPIKEDIQAFEHHLARLGMSWLEQKKHPAKLRLLVEKVEARTYLDIRRPTVEDFLAARSRERKWSAKTHDNYLDAYRAFGRFLEGRYTPFVDPFLGIKTAAGARPTAHYGGEITGVRSFRREELTAIFAVVEPICGAERARGRSRHHQRPASNRDWFYRLLLLTGLRYGEMCELRWKDVVLEDGEPRILCDPAWAKSRRFDQVPLCEEAADLLAEQRKYTGPASSAPVFLTAPTLNTLNRDMKRAGVAKRDGRGRAAGYHSFRKGLNRLLRELGRPIEERRSILRHTDIRLTGGAYGDVMPDDLRRAMKGLSTRANPEELSTGPPPPENSENENLTRRGSPADHDPAQLVGPHAHSTDSLAPALLPGRLRTTRHAGSGLGLGRAPADGWARFPDWIGGLERTVVGVRIPPSPLHGPDENLSSGLFRARGNGRKC